MAKEYKDQYTLDNRVKPALGVSEEKAAAAADLMSEVMSGSRIAKGTFEEAMSSTDLIFNVAHVAQLQVLADFPEVPESVADLGVTTLTVSDFRPATLYSIRGDWKDGGVLGNGTPLHVAPRIPEGANYPYAYLEQESNQQVGGISKRGFKTGFTFEAFINDSVGFIQSLPTSMSQIATDTDTWEIINALVTGVGDDQQLKGTAATAPLPDPNAPAVAPNAPISRAAIWQAAIELDNREINGRKVIVSGGYKLVIPAGQRKAVEFMLYNVLVNGYHVTTGNNAATATTTDYQVIGGYDSIGQLTIVESEFLPAGTWYLIPAANQARRPILQLLRLVGHELPELRVSDFTGSFVGGGAVAPFEGSFDNDSADFRLRMFTKGQLWTPDLVVWSDGSGNA